ncbi:MAG: hypothetical protein MUE91_01075 [Ignavibacteriaceae bacterium]|jgi:hypothetical protein|nr:hypothetical protein [Ignavibacteriaceae bacterium]MCU0412984.1 hypothetical protein [Ignavibacteriaceae bacterium]
MKHKVTCLLLAILFISITSCSDGPINKITLQNIADGDVYLNFRGTQTLVPSGSTIELQDIDKGEYEYETVYEIPVGATAFSAEGEMSGSFIIGAGTKILVIYSSVFDQEGNYTIYASVTSSDNMAEDGILPNPIGP